MNTRMQDYRLLWRAAVSHGNPFNTPIVRFGGLVFLLAGMAMQWKRHGVAGALAGACGLFCAMLLMVWAYRFLPGAVKLAAPANAKLVPRMRGRLVELFCLVWFAGTAGIVLASFTEAMPGLVLLWCVAITLGSALAGAGHPAGLPVLLGVVFLSVSAEKFLPALGSMLSHPASLVLAVLLSAGLAVFVAGLVFPEGGEGHWRMVARRARMADLAVNPGAERDRFPGLRSRRWYAATLRRDSARRDSRRLVKHALGSSHHVDELAMGLVMLSVVVFVIGTFIGWQVGEEVIGGIGWLIACSLLAVPFATNLRLTQLLTAYTGEQSLVRLAPAMPSSAPAFNRHLALALLRGSVKDWALAACAALAVAALGGTERDKLVNLACVCCQMLPMVAAPLRNYAVRKAASPMLPIVLLLAAIGASVIVGVAVGAVFGTPVLPVAAVVSVGIALAAVLRGLRVMEGAPFAFPAARMD
ncbi:hypothetical protein LQ564_17475 [Massilia sp. G4R7]|uniref:ABC transporter permease n=1 Tax=Massilia phyllostachyos TaxID=2898585 RepID=A0ABS8Q979_9BURK|nr:hypothetical protein [Massilia phyllostachyos]MCD2518103.1 hypothetical protein [Massilia phyllostachyos]